MLRAVSVVHTVVLLATGVVVSIPTSIVLSLKTESGMLYTVVCVSVLLLVLFGALRMMVSNIRQEVFKYLIGVKHPSCEQLEEMDDGILFEEGVDADIERQVRKETIRPFRPLHGFYESFVVEDIRKEVIRIKIPNVEHLILSKAQEEQGDIRTRMNKVMNKWKYFYPLFQYPEVCASLRLHLYSSMIHQQKKNK